MVPYETVHIRTWTRCTEASYSLECISGPDVTVLSLYYVLEIWLATVITQT